MPELQFQDEVFETAERWPVYYFDERFFQRYRHQGGRIFAETVLRVHGTVEAALSLLQGPWHWWDNGRIIGFRKLDGASTEQVLAPVWWYWTRVGMLTMPPLALEHEEGLRLPILLSRHFRGPASIDLSKPDGADGLLVLRGRFHGVENHVPFVPLDLSSRVHLRAEAGTNWDGDWSSSRAWYPPWPVWPC